LPGVEWPGHEIALLPSYSAEDKMSMSRGMHVYMAWAGITLHLPFHIGILFIITK